MIANYLATEDVLLDLEVAGKSQLFEALGQHMERQHHLQAALVVAGLVRREQLGPTALGQGIAVPHARVKELDRILIAYARVRTPIPFDAPDGGPVTHVLVLLVPKQATEEHLQILAEAAQQLSDRAFRQRLQTCATPAEVKRLFEQ
jgi:PTS system nitrogen regulatory IIA component